ncbi:MAG: TetR/AcrR family transcriptional regulator [Alphaproteobacteria bacterium]|nr:TetR/AcrR family transcriptional regulator [Alphaproteobacteria bacterium]MBV9695018.1 TetR/AcrR family transcriptional regulator [Alphaproteobacteria bacterium]
MLIPDARTAAEAVRGRLIAAASEEFNARGIAGASVARIAKSVGLSRAAVYYYVADRADLAAQCYREAVSRLAADLSEARGKKGTGRERLLALVRKALDSDRVPPAAITELPLLERNARGEIAAAHAANVAGLRAILRSGMADGSLRNFDDEIVAQTIIGTITWIPLSLHWVEGTSTSYRSRTVDAVCDLLIEGQARDRGFKLVSPVAIENFFPPQPSAFDRKANAEAKIEALLQVASQMFNRNGIDGVSLDDIADAVGATKGVLYHYFRNKSDLVVRCYRRAFRLYEQFVDAAEIGGRTGLERAMIGLHLNVQAHASGLSPLIQLVGSAALPPAVRREITGRARALQRRYERFGRDGIDDRTMRKLDFDAVAQLGAGAFQWLPKWFSSDDPRARTVLADEIVSLFVNGLGPER